MKDGLRENAEILFFNLKINSRLRGETFTDDNPISMYNLLI